jgi:hypothetical protein
MAEMAEMGRYSAKSNTIETIVRLLYCNTNNLIYNQARFKQPSKHGGVCLLVCKSIEALGLFE